MTIKAIPQNLEFEDTNKKFEVNGIAYKARMTQIEKDEFKIKIYQCIDDKWVKIYRKIVEADFFENIELLDWNLDGKLDVKFRFVAGATTENYHTLLLFDSTGKFVEIEKYWLYGSSYQPDEVLISSDSMLLYYSNIYWGCAGYSYQSRLFTCRANKLVAIAYANIDFCDEPYEITVYQLCPGPDSIYNVYSYDYVMNYQEDDWQAFINHFWRHHYKEFLN